ncbi:MAG: hypothetical protein C0623_11140 [Desulfuromonas sp.]|nr:MAG: hypothetical protein C0623_11140 [Desulfuromonas sp.]
MKLAKLTTISIIIGILALPVAAFAAAQVTIDTLVEKQVVSEDNGTIQTRYVKTENTVPGDTLRFTLLFRNSGDAVAENVVIDNPIPSSTLYLAGSVTTYKQISPLFSIDSGKSFRKPSLLTYETTTPDGNTETKVASPEKYTHIRWQIPTLPPGESGQVSFEIIIQ